MDTDNISKKISEIKHLFMVYRNGIVADALRKAGMPYDYIFGLQLPQIAQIAKENTPSPELANALWNDHKVRESRLLACYLFPKEMPVENVIRIIESLQTREEAEILSFKFLRFHEKANQILKILKEKKESANSNLIEYCADIFEKNLSC